MMMGERDDLLLRYIQLGLNNGNRVFGEAKEICLVIIHCCPLSMKSDWAKVLPTHPFIVFPPLSLVDGDPRYVCNAWKKQKTNKNIPFSQEILLTYFYELCNKMQVNVLGVLLKLSVTLLCSMQCWRTKILTGCLVLTAGWSEASLVLPAYDT